MHKDQQEAQGAFHVFLQERQKNLLVICCCGYRILNGTLEHGTLIAVMNLIGQVQLLFANLSGYVPQYYAMLASAERLMEVEGFADAFVEDPHPLDGVLELYDRELVSIDFRSVSFSYGPITNATSGGTGGGRARSQKEDAHELLRIDPQGLYRSGDRPIWLRQEYHAQGFDVPLPAGRRGACLSPGGEMRLDGRWRELFAYVLQGNQLMAGSIREAITFGDESYYGDDEGIWRVFRASDAEGFVSELPGGLDAELGEHRSGLSEGQVKRLAIARAIYAGHPVLLLDESTSSLDDGTERDVLTNIKSMTDCTVVLVTHRKAPLGICDLKIDVGKTLQDREG